MSVSREVLVMVVTWKGKLDCPCGETSFVDEYARWLKCCECGRVFRFAQGVATEFDEAEIDFGFVCTETKRGTWPWRE